jgi:hypothetical protein
VEVQHYHADKVARLRDKTVNVSVLFFGVDELSKEEGILRMGSHDGRNLYEKMQGKGEGGWREI